MKIKYSIGVRTHPTLHPDLRKLDRIPSYWVDLWVGETQYRGTKRYATLQEAQAAADASGAESRDKE